MTLDRKKLEGILANNQHRTNYFGNVHDYKRTIRTAKDGDEGLLCVCGFHVRQEWLDEATKAIDTLYKEALVEYDKIFSWLLGENGDFPVSEKGKRYTWRGELRDRIAALKKGKG